MSHPAELQIRRSAGEPAMPVMHDLSRLPHPRVALVVGAAACGAAALTGIAILTRVRTRTVVMTRPNRA
jgi:hypothetical protein